MHLGRITPLRSASPAFGASPVSTGDSESRCTSYSPRPGCPAFGSPWLGPNPPFVWASRLGPPRSPHCPSEVDASVVRCVHSIRREGGRPSCALLHTLDRGGKFDRTGQHG